MNKVILNILDPNPDPKMTETVPTIRPSNHDLPTNGRIYTWQTIGTHKQILMNMSSSGRRTNPHPTSVFLLGHLGSYPMGILITGQSLYNAREKSPYFLFHGETALRKILKFQGETANFSDKFQREIQVFPGENEGFPVLPFSRVCIHFFQSDTFREIQTDNKK